MFTAVRDLYIRNWAQSLKWPRSVARTVQSSCQIIHIKILVGKKNSRLVVFTEQVIAQRSFLPQFINIESNCTFGVIHSDPTMAAAAVGAKALSPPVSNLSLGPMDPKTFPTYPDLAGKVALITGIGQVGLPDSITWGNGAATARVLSHNGVHIFGCDLNLTAAERTKSRLEAANPGAICDVVTANATKAEDMQRVVDACMARHGRIDILVNNVGMTAPGDPGTMSEDVWDAQIELNLKSVYLTSHLVFPIMERQGSGSVINNASITSMRYIGKPQIAYASAKAAVVQFTKACGVMYAPKGIRVNCVVPGLMYTPLVENLGASTDERDREVFRKITEHNVPMGKLGDGDDMGTTVAFLCSISARYITGQALVVDGGITESTGTGV